MMSQTPPDAPEDIQRLGRLLYSQLYGCLTSNEEWFTRGFPGEWRLACQDLQRTLSEVQRRVDRALEAEQERLNHQQPPLFPL